jgi:hypothetical protein
MKHQYLSLAASGLILALCAIDASAVQCAAGVNRAGCVGPNGNVATTARPAAVHHPAGSVRCADGVYRTACTGPAGNTAVIRR